MEIIQLAQQIITENYISLLLSHWPPIPEATIFYNFVGMLPEASALNSSSFFGDDSVIR
jgi:hypothetical protein